MSRATRATLAEADLAQHMMDRADAKGTVAEATIRKKEAAAYAAYARKSADAETSLPAMKRLC